MDIQQLLGTRPSATRAGSSTRACCRRWRRSRTTTTGISPTPTCSRSTPPARAARCSGTSSAPAARSRSTSRLGRRTTRPNAIFSSDWDTVWIGENVALEIDVSNTAPYSADGTTWHSAWQERQSVFRALASHGIGGAGSANPLQTRGADRNRTGVNGFAGRCVTTPPRRRSGPSVAAAGATWAGETGAILSLASRL
jgi:hypothetical protein